MKPVFKLISIQGITISKGIIGAGSERNILVASIV